MIVARIAAAQQTAGRRKMQGHVALELDGAHYEISRWNHHRAAAIVGARIDGRLHSRGIERFAVTFGAVIAHV